MKFMNNPSHQTFGIMLDWWCIPKNRSILGNIEDDLRWGLPHSGSLGMLGASQGDRRLPWSRRHYAWLCSLLSWIARPLAFACQVNTCKYCNSFKKCLWAVDWECLKYFQCEHLLKVECTFAEHSNLPIPPTCTVTKKKNMAPCDTTFGPFWSWLSPLPICCGLLGPSNVLGQMAWQTRRPHHWSSEGQPPCRKDLRPWSEEGRVGHNYVTTQFILSFLKMPGLLTKIWQRALSPLILVDW